MATSKDPVCGSVNANELGRICGVSRRMVYKWLDKGMPRDGRLFDVAASVQWLIASLTERANEEPEDIMEARRQLYVAQTAKTKLETQRLSGSLVDLEEARGLLRQIGAIVAGQLDAVAPRLAAEVAGIDDQKTIQELLFDEHRIVRASIAGAIVGLPAGSGGHGEPAAEADGGPVGGRESDPATGEPGAGPVAH